LTRVLRRRVLVSVTVVVAAAAMVPAASAKERTLRLVGATSQAARAYGDERLASNQVSLILAARGVRALSIPWVASCESATGAPADPLIDRTVVLDTLALRDGRFSASGDYGFSPGSGQEADVSGFALRGKLTGHRVTGVLSVAATLTFDGQPAGDCATAHTIHFTASPRRKAADLSGPPERPRPVWPGLVAYVSTDSAGGSAIWMSDPDGRQARQLTRPPSGDADSEPSLFAATGTLAFVRTMDGVSRVDVVQGNRVRDISAFIDGGASDPAISSDGETVAFSARSGANCTLRAVRIDGSHPVVLTSGPGCDSQPAWSPDGRQLLYRHTTFGPTGTVSSTEFRLLDLKTGTTRTLSFLAAASAVSWEPGKRLAVLATVDGTPTLQTVGVDGRGLRTLARSTALTGRPAWSPVADAIAITLQRPDGSTALATVSAAGGPVSVLSAPPGLSESEPSWTVPLITSGGQEPGPGVHIRSARPSRSRRRKRG
jgi:Tol biopolymer transport system component